MAQTEEVILLEVKTLDAVKNVNDLKENISALKHNLGLLDIGSQDYTDTLNALKVSQNALKDAMYATSASLDDVKASATGASESYNSLVHRMAALKEEWRATNDEARRNDVGRQIAEINQQLKDMDASVGNFQRNVGNYESGVTGLVAKFDEWGGILKQMPPTLGAAKESIGKVGETMQLVGKQPILGIIGLLAPIIMKITESLKENETAMGAVKNLMQAIQPVFDVLQGVIEKVAEGLSKAVGWFVEFIGQSEGIKNVLSAVSGVGNAILQYLLAPIKAAVAAFKGLGKIIGDVFKGDWGEIKTHARQAGEEMAEAYKDGFSFKSNFEEGKIAGAKFITGVKAKENIEQAKQAGKEIAKAVNDGFNEWEDEQRALADEESFNEEFQAQLDATEAYQKEQNERMWNNVAERIEMQEAEKDAIIKAKQEETEIVKKMDEEQAKSRVETLMSVADATSGLLSSIADMYESDEKSAEKNAKKIKNLRIASATIDMLNGAVMAYSSAQSLGVPLGPVIGGINAAAVIAMGIANINKIKSTNPSGSGASASAAAPAVVSAPNIDTGLQSVRQITTASEEERLNRMASDQRVYILDSDIEAAENRRKTQVEESSF